MKPTTMAKATVFPSRLAFDPGHTTGYAFMEENNVVLTGTIAYTHLSREFLNGLLRVFQPSEVLVESMPVKFTDKITATAYHLICEVVHETNITLLTVSPGVWKPIRTKVDPFWREHIKDAVELLYHR